ncbi:MULTISPECIES: cytochrome c oxidase subunit CcoM [unclassified Oleiphilus]|jgi:phosphatidylglycerophosphatase A|nr:MULTISPECIES: cytochrome c oxidase subunit CcoM [unclassified Oleiphilus]
MYFDETIAASLLVIGGTIAFLGGFAWFVYKDLQKSKQVKVKNES